MTLKIVETALRDGHQSLFATRMTTDEILSTLEELDLVGYYALEVWGGATFDSSLRFLNEDPWERLRKIKKLCPNTKLQMLFRGQNILGYRHYPDDIVEKFVQKSIENGIDIIRVFDALNDTRNLQCSVDAIKKYKGHCQIALCYTISPIHTIEYYLSLAKTVEAMGADSICIKDMAGLLLPEVAYNLIYNLKKITKLPINLHSHCTGGLMDLTYMRAIEAGVDIIDTAISPISGGASQPPTESFQILLENTPYNPLLNMKMLDKAAEKLTIIKDKYLANGIFNPKALTPNPSILKYQIPGGMLSNLMNQLKEQNLMHLFEAVLQEVPKVRKDMGYPPLVTPLSQMVATQALFNVITGIRYKNVPKEIKEYLHGAYGAPPGLVNEDIRKQIIGNDLVITTRPADTLKPEFEIIKNKHIHLIRSDEDVLSIALFETVALNYLTKKHQELNLDEPLEFNIFIGGEDK